jgi:lysophospholipase L1-like esterase
MNKKWIFFPFIFLILFGCSALKVNLLSDKTSSLKEKDRVYVAVQKKLKMVAIGDSLTEGIGDKEGKNGYVGRVQELLEQNEYIKEVETVNFGVKGYKTTNLLNMLNKDDVKKELADADIIVLTIGANDLMKVMKSNIFSLTYEPFRKERENYQERLKDIFHVIRSYNKHANLYYIGLYNPFQLTLPDVPEIDVIVQEWNETSAELVAKDSKATYVSIVDIFTQDGERLLSDDEFHPNEKAYTYIAERVYEAIIRDRKI